MAGKNVFVNAKPPAFKILSTIFLSSSSVKWLRISDGMDSSSSWRCDRISLTKVGIVFFRRKISDVQFCPPFWHMDSHATFICNIVDIKSSWHWLNWRSGYGVLDLIHGKKISSSASWCSCTLFQEGWQDEKYWTPLGNISCITRRPVAQELFSTHQTKKYSMYHFAKRVAFHCSFLDGSSGRAAADWAIIAIWHRIASCGMSKHKSAQSNGGFSSLNTSEVRLAAITRGRWSFWPVPVLAVDRWSSGSGLIMISLVLRIVLRAERLSLNACDANTGRKILLSKKGHKRTPLSRKSQTPILEKIHRTMLHQQFQLIHYFRKFVEYVLITNNSRLIWQRRRCNVRNYHRPFSVLAPFLIMEHLA